MQPGEQNLLNEKVQSFQNAMLAAAELYLDKRPKTENDTIRSPELDSLFAQRQIAKDGGWYIYAQAKTHTNKIRTRLRKERPDNTIQQLEQNLWYDIKKAKSKIVPSHIKLKRQDDGTVFTSNERPDILAGSNINNAP